jgi:transposase
MSNKRKPYNTYTKEFELEALRVMEQLDRPASEISMTLGEYKKNKQYT